MRRRLLIAGLGFWFAGSALAEVAPKTFFRDGIWSPLYGDLGLNSSQLGGVDVTLDHLKFGIQMLRVGDFSLTGGYGMVGVSGSPWLKKDAPKNYRAHVHGPIAAIHWAPDLFIHASLSYAPMNGTVHYEDTSAIAEEKGVTRKASITDLLAELHVKVWTDFFLSLGYGVRSSNLRGEDINLDMGDQSSGLMQIGIRGSVL